MDQSTRGVTVYSEYSLPFFMFYFLRMIGMKRGETSERGGGGRY